MKMQNSVLQKIKEPKQCERTFANPVARNGVIFRIYRNGVIFRIYKNFYNSIRKSSNSI